MYGKTTQKCIYKNYTKMYTKMYVQNYTKMYKTDRCGKKVLQFWSLEKFPILIRQFFGLELSM